MKTKYLISLFFVLFVGIDIQAEPVSVDKAMKVAANFMMQKHTYITKDGKELKMLKSVRLTNVATRSLNYDSFYIFNLNDNKGWVIVSGDDSVTPILGYSTNGSFNIDSIGPNTKELLDSYNVHIKAVSNSKSSETNDVAKQWSELLYGKSNKYVNNRNKRQVYPLIQTQWGQSPYYNAYCPYDYYYDELTLTGCVATAMAQIMNYWEYPERGAGFHSYNHEKYGTLSANFGATDYDWDNMPNELNSSSSYNQIDAVATLMYDCGVSVEMNYGTGVSGAQVISKGDITAPCAENALKSFFDYKNTLQGISLVDFLYEYINDGSSQEEFEEDWENMLKNELDNDRPILYAGYDNDGGHAFVCDGYDNNDFFHFNWGWSGVADGYFHFLDLTPDEGVEGSNYTSGQQIVIGIEPNDMSQHNFDLRLYSDLYMEDEIWFGDEIELYADIANFGNATFEGYLCAAVFDKNGYFVDYIQVGEGELQGGYYGGVTFYNEGNVAFVPGLYQVMLFYGTELGDWILIDDGEYSNYAIFEIYYSSDIEVYSDFTILSDDGKLINGSIASINVDVLNTDFSTFNGDIRLSLSNLDGSHVQTIDEIEVELQYDYHFTNGLTFDGIITAEPGTYHLSVGYRRAGTNSWYYAGASDYPNPIQVVVEAADISPDSYENNNTQNTAYNLNINWNNNHATISTVNSSLHIGNDVDYYKIVLPEGYNYEITARLFDEYTNEVDYTVDAMFSYSINGSDYSEPYDDVMEENIILEDGKTVYFIVAAYFQGLTGTYKFKIDIDRDSNEIDLDVPSNLKANVLSTSSIILTWDNVENALSYNVYRDGDSIANVTNPTYTDVNLEYNTEYCYIVTAVRNETESDKSEEACAKTLGESIEELSSSFKIYPNPVENELFLATEVSVEEIAIYDVYGRMTYVYCLQTTDFVHNINVADLEAGIYFVKVVTSEGNIVKRFIKN